jgi:hypothetical protein
MWATCPRSASSGYHTEFREACYQKHTNQLNCRASSSDISGYHAEFHEACYQKHTNPLNCRASSSDISGYHTDFSRRTRHCRRVAGARYGTCQLTRHGMGSAWALHGMCELGLNVLPFR